MPNEESLIIGQTDFTPIYRLNEHLEMLNERERARIEKQRQESIGVGKYYDQVLSDKENLSGTPLDPNIRSMLIDARGIVAAMNKKNAGFENIQAALGPMVSKINEYQQKASAYKEQKQNFIRSTDKMKGIKTEALNGMFDREMFRNPDGSLKDIKDVNVDNFDQWASDTIEKNAIEATTSAGFQEFAGKFKPSSYDATLEDTDKKGAKVKKVYNVEAPEWTQLDPQGQFVPRYTEAMAKDDNGDGVPELFDFSNDKSKKDLHPIRLLDEPTFDHLIANDPIVHARLAAKVRAAGFEGSLESDQRSKLAARAMAYDELKPFAYGNKKESVVNKEAPAPKVNITVKTSKEDDTPSVDLWPDFSEKASTGKAFNSTEAGIVRSIGNNYTGASEGANSYGVRKNADGDTEIFTKVDITQEKDAAGRPTKKIPANTALGTVDQNQFNALGNQLFGIKAKTKQLKKDQTKKLTWDAWKKANPSGSFIEFQAYLKTK